MVAWLVTWEWVGDHARMENKIAAILNYRLSPERAGEIVELIYVNEQFTLSERIAYAKSKGNNPYPAQFDSIHGVPWTARIICGHNPFLYARLVDDLRVEIDKSGKETLNWKERPRPNVGLTSSPPRSRWLA